MAKRICERVQIGTDVNGKPIYEWVTGYSRQEVFLNAAAILQKYGQIEGGPQKEPPKTPYFEAYMEEWWKLYKQPKLRHTTRTTYRNLLDRHILLFSRENGWRKSQPARFRSFTMPILGSRLLLCVRCQ